ncbi:LysR family transcriptional regulator [Belnapia sp. T18]|uniref:LysR family transcriptional regulator n=1 Tax=Belnapia arida TaxID=2804533 RepID=A0ABS1UD60_9PROT|nr:LysR family transcriptional regulator [Belnapia arida]MBL6081879.1 LysR family transcriptional regulator [Belnapia arida]
MDLRQLRYFVRIVEQRSMSRASIELGVAQLALSLQIAMLETRLHRKLLRRRSTGVFPTEAGQALYRHAVAILRQVKRAERDIEYASDEPSGPASLGLPTVVQDLLALELFGAVRARLPAVSLRLLEGGELPAEGDGPARPPRHDGHLPVRPDARYGRTAAGETIYLVSPTASKLRRREGAMPLEAVLQYPLVLSSGQTAMRRLVQAGAAAQARAPEVLADIDSLRTLLDIAEQRHAHTILPASALQRHLKGAAAGALLLHPLEMSRHVVLSTSEHLPLGLAATTVQNLLCGVIESVLKEKRWIGIHAP